MKKGLVHVYTGDGKGKTTSAVGLGLRAYGRGFKVLLIQFLKSEATGEIMAIEKLGTNFSFFRNTKIEGFFWQMNDEKKHQLMESEQDVFSYAVTAVSSNEWDMIILDEVMGSVSNGLIQLDDLKTLIKNKPEKLELVLTGRDAPERLVEMADYVSNIQAVKHPFQKGIPSRIGIES